MEEPTDRASAAAFQGLTSFQIQVAQLFFSLPASTGFLLAGGAALVAQHLTTRATQDLDFFTGPGQGEVPTARDAFEVAAIAQGWAVHRVRDTATFCRLVVSGPEDLLVDLAVDAPANLPPIMSMAGPTFGLEELAGRKVIALFDRAEARDFADVYILAQRYPKPLLLARAAEIDGSFDFAIFADMLDTLSRFDGTIVGAAAFGPAPDGTATRTLTLDQIPTNAVAVVDARGGNAACTATIKPGQTAQMTCPAP